MLLTIQPDLVRKDMRHETRLFLYGIKMDTPLDELRDGGHGFCPQRVESMVQGIFIPFVVDPQTFLEYAHLITPVRSVGVYHTTFGKAVRLERTGGKAPIGPARCPYDPSLEGPSFEGWPGISQSGLLISASSWS